VATGAWDFSLYFWAVDADATTSQTNSAGPLLDSALQMRCFGTKNKQLTRTKYVKIGEHEQDR